MSVAGPRGPKRGPSVLVTDARETRPAPAPPPLPLHRPQVQRAGTRIISVDNVLQYASEIPSAQPRRGVGGGVGGVGVGGGAGGGLRPSHGRTLSGRHPLDPKLSGRGVPLGGGGGGGGAAHMPARSSKTSEKLVLLPETSEEADGALAEEEEEEDGDDEAKGPPRDEELLRRRLGGRAGRGKSEAERLPKSQRTAEARVTAYCTAQSYKLRGTAAFVRDRHGAKTKLYDDCLYCVYQLPLLGGSDGYRVRSSPVVKNPGGRSVLDEQIEANERREYREGWHEESSEYSVPNETADAPSPSPSLHGPPSPESERRRPDSPRRRRDERERSDGWTQHGSPGEERRESHGSGGLGLGFPSPQAALAPDAPTAAELFVFSCGVAVLWNFTPNQEKDLLADLTFSSANTFSPTTAGPHKAGSSSSASGVLTATALAAAAVTHPLMVRPLDEGDFETEEFHFQCDGGVEKARIYNDMITLRGRDHMVQLAMSHAIAQSTKLSFFEARMQRTMAEAQHVPRQLALAGRLGMTRIEVIGLVGRLFEGRVDVNLSSNMLDTPSFFWDSEPTLHPLYEGVREYLEIRPRIQVLNERCRVFLDLAEMLSDSIADGKMTRITWIIIVLIVLSILVTCTEVFLRFGLIAQKKTGEGEGVKAMRALWMSGGGEL